VGGIKDKTHKTSPESTSDRDGENPGREQKGHTLEVDSLERTVTETDTDGGTGNAHGG
jgi:hypothetical protein